MGYKVDQEIFEGDRKFHYLDYDEFHRYKHVKT